MTRADCGPACAPAPVSSSWAAASLGLEVASTVLDSGAQAVVIENAERLLPNALPAPFSRWLAARAAARGARLHLGARIASVVRDADGRTPGGAGPG